MGKDETLTNLRSAPPSDTTFHRDAITWAKGMHKDLDALRKDVTGPLNAQVKAENARFKPALEFLEEVEAICRGKLAEHERHVRLAAQAAEAEAARLAAANRPAEAIAVLRQSAAAAPTPGGVSFRRTFRAVVVDAAALPRDVLMPDPVALARRASELDPATQSPRPVSGVVFEEILTPVVK